MRRTVCIKGVREGGKEGGREGGREGERETYREGGREGEGERDCTGNLAKQEREIKESSEKDL
jgi:hypothetical protein